MSQVFYNYDLSTANTMALSSSAAQAVFIDSEEALSQLPNNLPFVILSGGSNVLLPAKLNATVLLPRLIGIVVTKDSDDEVLLQVMAGENWHQLVTFCTARGWYGLENLALIPGMVGAAPVQNIGAYGVQLEDVLIGVRAFDLADGTWHFFDKDACQFRYRDSIFKSRPSLFITCLHLRLHKDPVRIHTSYGNLAQAAKAHATTKGLSAPTPQEVMQAVIDIRSSKLPDPAALPNCGSFFKNPIITIAQYNTLKLSHPTLPCYQIDDSHVKVPAGWLIDKAGLKGQGIAPIFTHTEQALVLTNHAARLNTTASQADIARARDYISQTVMAHFGIALHPEPVWLNQDGSIGVH